MHRRHRFRPPHAQMTQSACQALAFFEAPRLHPSRVSPPVLRAREDPAASFLRLPVESDQNRGIFVRCFMITHRSVVDVAHMPPNVSCVGLQSGIPRCQLLICQGIVIVTVIRRFREKLSIVVILAVIVLIIVITRGADCHRFCCSRALRRDARCSRSAADHASIFKDSSAID